MEKVRLKNKLVRHDRPAPGAHDGYLPCFVLITEDNVRDVKAAHRIHFSPGTIVVDDRGYK